MELKDYKYLFMELKRDKLRAFSVGFFILVASTLLTVQALFSQQIKIESYSSKFGYNLRVSDELIPLECNNGTVVDFYPREWKLDCDDLRQPGQLSISGPLASLDQFPDRGIMATDNLFSPYIGQVSKSMKHGDQVLIFHQVKVEDAVFEIGVDINDPRAISSLHSIEFTIED